MATVQPQSPGLKKRDAQTAIDTPRVTSESGAGACLVIGAYEVRRVLTCTKWSADHNEPVGNKFIHEVGVLDPTVLTANVSITFPRRAVGEHA